MLGWASNISANMRLDLGKQSIDLAPRTRISSKQIIMNGSACVSNGRKVVSFHETKARRHLSTCFLFSFSIAFLFSLSLSLLLLLRLLLPLLLLVLLVHRVFTRSDWCQVCLPLFCLVFKVGSYRLDSFHGNRRRSAAAASSILDDHRRSGLDIRKTDSYLCVGPSRSTRSESRWSTWCRAEEDVHQMDQFPPGQEKWTACRRSLSRLTRWTPVNFSIRDFHQSDDGKWRWNIGGARKRHLMFSLVNAAHRNFML